jgi:zinc/manganese transport system ATP-binding protein
LVAGRPIVSGVASRNGSAPRGGVEAAISLHDAGIRFGTRWVWQGVDLSVRAGEFLVVLGPNGAGKTTLLRVLLGLLRLTEGEVEVAGGDPRSRRRLVGYVPQRRTLDRDLYVRARDLVSLGVDGTRWGVALPTAARRAQREMVDEALEAVGAVEYADRPAGDLSGGEQQRLLLAQALVTRPRLLLLDEPLASLDLRSQAVITALVSSIARQRGITVVLVAHDVNPLVSVLDRVAYVAAERVTTGTPQEVITSERLSELYDDPIEVLHDSRGRIVVIGLDDSDSHHA